jgi:hypothetical protein
MSLRVRARAGARLRRRHSPGRLDRRNSDPNEMTAVLLRK